MRHQSPIKLKSVKLEPPRSRSDLHALRESGQRHIPRSIPLAAKARSRLRRLYAARLRPETKKHVLYGVITRLRRQSRYMLQIQTRQEHRLAIIGYSFAR